MTFVGTELAFESEIGGKTVMVTARAAMCGANHLPDDLREVAENGARKFLQAVGEVNHIKTPEEMTQLLLQGQYRGVKIIARVDPNDKTRPENHLPPVCWDPSQTTFKKL